MFDFCAQRQAQPIVAQGNFILDEFGVTASPKDDSGGSPSPVAFKRARAEQCRSAAAARRRDQPR